MDRKTEVEAPLDADAALDLLADGELDDAADPDGGDGAVADAAAPALRQRAARMGFAPLEPEPSIRFTPRPYQEDAVVAWTEAGGRGIVVLPTGAGKTVTALLAAAMAGVRPLVVVPTLELLKQWAEALRERLGLPDEAVGQVGGGCRQLRGATVITYDSAWRRLKDLQAFGMVIFDEVHHLPSASYRRIATALPAPFRLGLTATPERGDLRHLELERLVGPMVYRRSPAELARSRHIARFRQERLFIELNDEEEFQYHGSWPVSNGTWRATGSGEAAFSSSYSARGRTRPLGTRSGRTPRPARSR